MGVHYQHLVITLMVIFTSIAVIDRFTTNIWPMYLAHPSSPIFPDDWTATTFVIIGWIAGRELIVSSSFIYLLQCKCLANWIFEHKPSWLIIDDIHIANRELHRYIGWCAVALPIIIHSYLVFLPALNPQNKMIIHKEWMRPIDTDTAFYVQNYKDHTVHLAINDLYALFIVSLCFMLLFPLSTLKSIRSSYFTLANYTHLLAAALYAIELLRTPFTIHCWFFCGPIIILYILDRMCGIYWYRVSAETKLICKYNIDDDYVVLFVHIPNIQEYEYKTYLGDVFWINCNKYLSSFEFAHPFTSFYNHEKLDIESFLFSSSMRSFPSHRGHRFPIRRVEHEHISYNDVKKCVAPHLEMIRTDTVMSGKRLSVSGLVPTPSESIKLHTINLHKQQQMKLPKVSSYLSSPSGDAQYMTIDDDDVHNHNYNDTIMNHVSCSTLSLPAISYNHSDREASDSSTQTFKGPHILSVLNVSRPKTVGMRDIDSVINENIEVSYSNKKLMNDSLWNYGLIIRVQRDSHDSFTQYIADELGYNSDNDYSVDENKSYTNTFRYFESDITSYGPYRSVFCDIIKECLVNNNPIVLIGTGAGISPFLDFLLYSRSRDIDVFESRVDVYFCCRSVKLFQWITDVICGPKIKKQHNLYVNAHLTSNDNIKGYNDDINKNMRRASVGRMSFESLLRNAIADTKVFFCGSQEIEKQLIALCNELRLKMYRSHCF